MNRNVGLVPIDQQLRGAEFIGVVDHWNQVWRPAIGGSEAWGHESNSAGFPSRD
jgi:hypothetical protein